MSHQHIVENARKLCFFLKKSTYGHKQPHNLEFEALNFTSISYNPGISKLSTEGQILNIFGL